MGLINKFATFLMKPKEQQTGYICPGCFRINSNDDVCSYCNREFNAPVLSLRSRVKPTERRKLQAVLDLSTTVDRTGSSASFAKGIPMAYELVLRDVVLHVKVVNCTLASHGDLDYDEKFIVHCSKSDSDTAIGEMRSITYQGGGDPEEHHLDAIESLLMVTPWHANPLEARSVILCFASSESKPLRSGKSPKELGIEIRNRGILLYLVCERTTRMMELIKGADGFFFQISNSPSPEELRVISNALGKSIVASIQTGGTIV